MAPLPVVKPLVVDVGTECHVTPQDVSAKMVSYLDLVEGDCVLEPQGGTGNLVEAVLQADLSVSVVTVERHVELSNFMAERFKESSNVSVINSCFLEYSQERKAERGFNKIIMNPPFKHVKKHISAAFDLLCAEAPSCLVALVPITFSHPDAVTLETLNNDTFGTAKVNTKIIKIEVM